MGKVGSRKYPRKSRINILAMHYAAAEDAVMTAPDNRTIGELNAAVRSMLRVKGKLGEDVYQAKVLVAQRNVAEEDKKLALS